MRHLHIRHSLSWCIVALALTCCNRHNQEEINAWAEGTDEFSATHKGRVILSYHPLQDQTGTAHNEFWMAHDNLDYYFRIRLEQTPVEGESVKGDFQYKTDNGTRKEKTGLDFKLIKTGPDGKMWLYNTSQKIGLVIRLP